MPSLDPRAISVIDVRAEDVAEGDIVRINGNWVWVLATFNVHNTKAHIRQALEPYDVHESVVEAIRKIVEPNSMVAGFDGAYIAIAYARASTFGYGSDTPGNVPSLGVAAYALYDLLPAQIKESRP